jgi:leucyl aminopeptidase
MSSGACIVALGEKVAALYSSDDSLRHGIEAAARRSDEGYLHQIALECYPNDSES